MSDKVLVAIPTYNGWMRIHQMLQNIQQRTGTDVAYEVVICDDSGKEDHRKRVQEVCNQFGARMVYHQTNRGVPTSWNTLVKSSDADYIILLNDDILLSRHWLTTTYYAIKNNPKISSFGMHCYFITPQDVPEILADGKPIPLNVRWEGSTLIRHERFPSLPIESAGGGPGRMMCPTGCAFGFRRTMWEEVGGFDQRYKAFYEETDFGVACAYKGYPAAQLSWPGNYHIWSQTFASAPELQADSTLRDSKRKFVDKWSKTLKIKFNDAPELHNRLMNKIPLIEVKWLDENLQERTSSI
jgi:hypothetical protein